MKTNAVLIFPNQLFEFTPIDLTNKKIFLIEDPLFFGDKIYPLKFHKQKILLHRLTMKIYFNFLMSKNFDVKYLEYSKYNLEEELNNAKIINIEIIYLSDYILEKRVKNIANKLNIKIKTYDSPSFLTNIDNLEQYINKIKRPFFHSNFYIWQRKRLNILLNEDKTPKGGMWSFDQDNRKKLSNKIIIPSIQSPSYSEKLNLIIKDSTRFVKDSFQNNPGSINKFNYPLDFETAKTWLDQFLSKRLSNFGPYEDAIRKDSATTFHSVITPFLNIGLLTPEYVVNKVIEYSTKFTVSIQSLEGFLRQIIGWREFVRMVYYKKGVVQRSSNFFNHNNLLNIRFYEASTGITPIDDLISQLNETAYSHHITRLMLLGNFFLLIEMNPSEVYKWFMEMYIDSYDWVMVPNIYGMSQFSDGGTIVTKPYFSSSNYIKKMSNYSGKEPSNTKSAQDLIKKLEKILKIKIYWQDIWDGLFWRFLNKNSDFLKRNPRMGFLASKIEKNKEKIKIGDEYIKLLFT